MKKVLAALLLLILTDAAINAQQWKEFNSAKGKFSVMFPGNPAETVQPTDTDFGKLDIHMFLLKHKNSAYFVSYNEYPVEHLEKERIDSMLQLIRPSVLRAVEESQLLTQTTVVRDSFPGMQFTFSFQEGQMKGKHQSFLVGRRFYQIMMITPAEEFYDNENDQFFDSFKFYKGAENTLIADLLSELEITCDTVDGDNYKITFNIDSLRTQIITISTINSGAYERQIYEVWSFVHRINDKLGEAELNSLLSENADLDACAFQIYNHKNSESKMVILSAKIISNPDAKALMNVLSEIAVEADAKEKELNGKDEF